MSGAEPQELRAQRLVARAREEMDDRPDDARELLIEAAQLAAEWNLSTEYARACETLGWIALATDSDALAVKALESAQEAFRSDGDRLGEARVAAAFEYLAGPRTFANDAEAISAELSLVRALIAHQQKGDAPIPEPSLVAERTRLELRRRGRGDTVPSVLELRRALGLSSATHALLLGAAAPALDEDLARALRAAQGDLAARAPGVWFLRNLISPSIEEPIGLDLFDQAAPLRALGLVSLYPHPDRPQGALRHALVEIDPDVTAFLEGRRMLSSGIRELASLAELPRNYLEPSDGSAIDWVRLRTALSEGPPPRMAITGAPGAGKKTVAAKLAATLGQRLLVVRLTDVGADPLRLAAVCRTASRDALLHRALLTFDLRDGLGGAGGAEADALFRVVIRALADHPQAALLTARHPDTLRPLIGSTVLELHLPALGFDDQVQHISRALERQGAAVPPAAILRGAVCQAGLTPGAIEAAVVHAVARIRLASADRPAPTPDHLREAISVEVHNDLSSIAQRVRSPFGWNDLVLTPEMSERLREMLSHVRHQDRVFETWGFGAKMPYGRAVNALFAGPPGTGKTMAAGVIANELGIDLFRIDLSQVVSKYIGETEKNLGRVFDRASGGQAAILFDEADSLFAKRTDVKTSVDRYSNLEVNYLLQRLESFDGLAILTTNFLKNIDEAFRRRLRFLIEFPFPGPEERERLWRGMIPAEAEVRGEIPFEELAHFEMAGGNIKNAVMRAAFAAAARDDVILPYDFVQASLIELDAMGRLTPTLVTILDRLEKPPGVASTTEEDVIDSLDVAEDPPPAPDLEQPTDPPAPRIDRATMRPFLPQFPFPKRR